MALVFRTIPHREMKVDLLLGKYVPITKVLAR